MDLRKKGTNIEQKSEVWDKFAEGNHTYFKKVFNTYYKSMYGYGTKLCNQPELVKDCIQELFRNIWERRDELTHIESPNVYLFVSLRRKILNEIKSRRKLDGNLDEVDGNSLIQFGKEEIIIKNEVRFQQKKKLLQALNQLSDRQKEVIYLHFYNGMSYREIANILSINRQSVRNHMYRAMETLRSLLGTEILMLVV